MHSLFFFGPILDDPFTDLRRSYASIVALLFLDKENLDNPSDRCPDFSLGGIVFALFEVTLIKLDNTS